MTALQWQAPAITLAVLAAYLLYLARAPNRLAWPGVATYPTHCHGADRDGAIATGLLVFLERVSQPG